MLSRLRLTNFQSHRNTTLELGSFTVIVGPSSSGKSAVARALRVLVSNSRGTSYVSHGARSARIEGAFAQFEGDPLDGQMRIAVERGSGKSVYELQIAGDDEVHTFTKCGTSVPDMVSAAHDLGDDEMWLAGQFDRPFLLDENGSHIARVLGDLTNVSMIFAAVRECNRRASGAKTRLASRQADLDSVRLAVQDYVDLPTKLASCAAAEAALARVSELDQRRSWLRVICDDVESASARAAQLRLQLRSVPSIESLVTAESRRSRLAELVRTVEEVAARRSAIRLVSVPEISPLTVLAARRTNLRTVLTELVRAEVSRRQAVDLAERARTAAEEARDRLGQALTDAGMCPTCGASSEHARIDRVVSV
jgi:energy-coupling factor transporter ATP-binding protein EcfA2